MGYLKASPLPPAPFTFAGAGVGVVLETFGDLVKSLLVFWFANPCAPTPVGYDLVKIFRYCASSSRAQGSANTKRYV